MASVKAPKSIPGRSRSVIGAACRGSRLVACRDRVEPSSVPLNARKTKKNKKQREAGRRLAPNAVPVRAGQEGGGHILLCHNRRLEEGRGHGIEAERRAKALVLYRIHKLRSGFLNHCSTRSRVAFLLFQQVLIISYYCCLCQAASTTFLEPRLPQKQIRTSLRPR